MKNAAAILTFLHDLGIAAIINGEVINCKRADIENIGGAAEVLQAVTSTFGKGFFWGEKGTATVSLKSIY